MKNDLFQLLIYEIHGTYSKRHNFDFYNPVTQSSSFLPLFFLFATLDINIYILLLVSINQLMPPVDERFNT